MKKSILVASARAEGVMFTEYGTVSKFPNMNSCTPNKSYNKANIDKYLSNGKVDRVKSEQRKGVLHENMLKKELRDKVQRMEMARIPDIWKKAVSVLANLND